MTPYYGIHFMLAIKKSSLEAILPETNAVDSHSPTNQLSYCHFLELRTSNCHLNTWNPFSMNHDRTISDTIGYSSTNNTNQYIESKSVCIYVWVDVFVHEWGCVRRACMGERVSQELLFVSTASEMFSKYRSHSLVSFFTP